MGGTELIVRRGMTGATGNIYCGLHKFVDMAFMLHVLKPNDLFVDVGANIGSYTVLASGVCGAKTLAFEPDAGAANQLRRNIHIDELDSLVTLHEVALGDMNGKANFTVGCDTVNRVADLGEPETQIVAMRRLDDIPGASQATVIKLDVEGYESKVLTGAPQVLASRALIAVQTESQDDECFGILNRAGFVRRRYDPWSRKLFPRPTELKAANALFLRADAAILDRVERAPLATAQGQEL
jgi:FkbM family methyltransferase